MKVNNLKNSELGLDLHYWDGVNKKERIFLASQIMKQLGYKGGRSTLKNLQLEEKTDYVKVEKKLFPYFFNELSTLNVLGQRAGSVIMLYESGVWKLIMQSKKPIGIKTRNWLAREVLPSINAKGYYSINESENNPFSYLNDFTEEKTQKKTSKEVARKILTENNSFSQVYNQIHKLVVGMTAREIKEKFKSKESARELLRKNLPEYACTESVIDFLYTHYNKSFSEIEKSNAHKTLPPAFKSLYELGLKLNY